MIPCSCENCQRVREYYTDYNFGNFTDVSVNTQSVTNPPVQSTVVTTSSQSTVVVTSPPSESIQESNSNMTRNIILGLIGVGIIGCIVYGVYYKFKSSQPSPQNNPVQQT